MKKYLKILALFLFVFSVYFGVSTKFTFKPKWSLDYFNPLAQSLLHGRLDIVNPGTTYDLLYFQGKWYAPWGILPSLVLIPLQVMKNRFVPLIYINIFFASLNVVIVYLLLFRFRREFFPRLRPHEIFLVLVLFAFGTTHFYVGTLGSVWHVDQMLTFTLSILGVYVIFKKERTLKEYFASSLFFGLALLGRGTLALMAVLPGFLYVWEFFLSKKTSKKARIHAFWNGVLVFVVPFAIFSSLFFLYNIARFNNPFEYGYRYIQESPYLAQIRERNGIMSFYNMPVNLWYMLFEIPKLTFQGKAILDFNLKGNSIFFLSPPLLAALLALPIRRQKKRFVIDPYITSLWLAAIVVILPSLMIYSTGWMQFGFRYSLDITALLLLLSLYGMKGRLNILYILGIGFSIVMYWMGTQALM